MQRITNIRFFFIIIVLVVAMACQQTTDPATEPGKEVEAAAAQAPVDPADDLPESVRMLAPEYHQAYRLLPDGPWARKYIAFRLDAIESIEWERLKASYSGPYPQPVPEIDPGEEFQLRRVLTNAGDEEWLIRKVRSLDADAARQFEATQDVTERLETLRRLVEVEGKEQGVLEIEMEWQMRMAKWSEAEVARFLERERNSVALSEARRQWTPDEQREGHLEITVCDAVMNFVVGENPGVYLPDGRCDIAKVLAMTKEALEARGGETLYTEDDFREMVEYAQQNPGKWRHVSPSGAAQASVDPGDATEPDISDFMDEATAVTSEEPSEPAFEDTLEGDNLAKFQGLPLEFQGALNHVSETPQHPQTPLTSHEEALEFLRGLPDDVQPVSEVLPPETLDMFNELSDDDRSFVLLDMYARTFREKEFYADSPETERQALLEGMFEQLVKQVYEMEFGDGQVHLPPIGEALSADAVRKLDEIDPLIRRAFLLQWRNLRVPEEERDDFATKLERTLLAAPLELPPLEELGLSQEALKALEDVPNLRKFVEEYVAADLASTGAWDAVGTEYSGAMLLESLIARASTPEGSRMFAQGLLPVTTYQPPPLISHLRPGGGFWPLWAIPPFFRDMQPEDIVTEWPDHEQVLSQEALTKLNSLDDPAARGLREVLVRNRGAPERRALDGGHSRSLGA